MNDRPTISTSFGRREAPQSKEALVDKDGRSICPDHLVRQFASFRPGDRCDEAWIDHWQLTYDDYGYRSFSWFPPSPSLVINPDNVIEIVDFTTRSGAIFGLSHGDTIEQALTRFPQLVLEQENEYRDGIILKFYRGLLQPENWEIHITEKSGLVCRYALALPGASEARSLRTKQKLAEQDAIHAARIASFASDRWLMEPDADRMLDIWRAQNPTNRNGISQKVADSLPEQRSAMLNQINWDDGTAPLFWLVRQADTPIATIFGIFLDACPSQYCGMALEGSECEEAVLLNEIRRRLLSKFYVDRQDFDAIAAFESPGVGDLDNPALSPWRQAFLVVSAGKRSD